MFLVLLVLAVVSALGYSIWTSVWDDKMWYLYMSNGTYTSDCNSKADLTPHILKYLGSAYCSHDSRV